MSLLLLLLIVLIVLGIAGVWWGNRAGWWGARGGNPGPTYGVPFSNGSAPGAAPSGYVEGTAATAQYAPPVRRNPLVSVAIFVVALLAAALVYMVFSGFTGHIKQF